MVLEAWTDRDTRLRSSRRLSPDAHRARARRRRLARHPRRPAAARLLRRPRGGAARLRPSAAPRGADRRRRETLFFQSNACRSTVRERAARGSCAVRPEGLTRSSSSTPAPRRTRTRCASRSARPGASAWSRSRARSTAAPPRLRRVTWGSEQVVRLPAARRSRSRFVPRGDLRRSANALCDGAAALIVEPVQGMAGACDLGRDFLAAARELTAARRRAPDLRRGAVRHGPHRLAVRGPDATASRPTSSPRPRASPAASPPARCWSATSSPDVRQAGRPRHHLRRRPDGLRADRGGDRGDRGARTCCRACARSRRAAPRTCVVGPGRVRSRARASSSACAHAPGQGGPRRAPASAASSPARAPIPTSSACCRRSSSRRAHVDAPGARPAGAPGVKRFLDPARARRARRCATSLALAARPGAAPRATRSRRQGPGAAVLQPVAAHPRLVPGRDGAARRLVVRHLAGPGDLAARDARSAR